MSNVIIAEQPIIIRAEKSLTDPDMCKFFVNHSVHTGGVFFFSSAERAAKLPLAKRLFTLPGVNNVLIAQSVVTICKNPNAYWSELKASIGTTICTQLLTGVPAILGMYIHTRTQASILNGTQRRSDTELMTVIQVLLDKEINRSIANHASKILIGKICQGTLYISMSDGYQGCASSQVRLRQEFEVMLKKIAPEIEEVVDTTNPSAGKQPLYPCHEEAL
ncbi:MULTISPECIES: NifU family protein [unclassified Colwellia]|uniref:NifU family protein n=1 Tax=unclassified Colwellia TaxID=196834 RepID=UPI0015F54077|nr:MULTISPECIES: NifU family protein [unclassified Colwellia]MBA6232749.1 NifU family protein [Colwellia sp. MB02u-7]MBA6236163.1 NifU family protein [Colwellia sp. MB02u-11]MBA6256585.1 NifU family protein [Colwellia sp. MB3u-28]MBA6261300.1 NifU family protein [Colwellia sp. MB3u-41]MBA6298437.1 NifU family protein [Colwellia sp. MB3u-22]